MSWLHPSRRKVLGLVLPATAQQRIRAEAARLDAIAPDLPRAAADDELEPGVTAAQLRLVADLLDFPSWGIS